MKAALVTGGVTYLAARFVFSAHNRTAIWLGVGVAIIGWWVSSPGGAPAVHLADTSNFSATSIGGSATAPDMPTTGVQK